MTFAVTSSAFAAGGEIPKQYTCKGADTSPPLGWSGAPANAAGFALIVDDPDAPSGTWTHWLLFDIPPTVHTLAQGYAPGGLGVSGTNDFGKLGYGGPCPPKGHGPHRYFFKLCALDVATLEITAGVTAAGVTRALEGHALGKARYMGRFERG